MLQANLMALCFIEVELWPIEVLHYENNHFLPFYSCDLDLDPMTFIYELDPYTWRYTACVKMNFLRPDFRKLSSDSFVYIQTLTDRQDWNYAPRRFASGQKWSAYISRFTGSVISCTKQTVVFRKSAVCQFYLCWLTDHMNELWWIETPFGMYVNLCQGHVKLVPRLFMVRRLQLTPLITQTTVGIHTSSSAIAERPRCRVRYSFSQK